MPSNAINGVVGTDGIVPVYEPEGRWCFWGLHEIWVGDIGANRYVPKVNDYVIEYNTYTTYIVDHIDPITLIPTLREIRPANMSFSFTETDVLFGVGPGTQSDTYRVYVDKSVTPYILAVDARLKIAGTMSHHAKIFKGSNVSNTGVVVSKVYDNSGHLISQDIGLELVAIDSHVNYSIKTVKVCNTTAELMDGEIVTIVIYTDNGHVVSKRQLLVENTSFIRSVNSSLKYVSHISVDCPFMSPTESSLIEFPLNVPLNALNLMGTVHYSDGSTLTLPVDGNKFRMHGLQQHVSTIIGQRIELVLAYALSPTEVAYAGVSTDGHYVTEPYSLMTINPNNSYTVKLFGYPIWIDAVNGYQMQWWLFNLDRNVYFNVTPFVSFATNTGPFNPTGYGYLQRKAVSINLRDVSGAFKPFVHTQLVDIVLNGGANETITPWTMAHESISTRPSYGNGLKATKVSATTIKIDSGITDFNEWKERMYGHIYPLVDRVAELNPPTPTHFVIEYSGLNIEFPISNWGSNLNIGMNIPIYKTITVRFLRRTGNGDMHLGISALMVKA